MRFATPLCLGVIAAAALAGPAHPQDADDSLRLYTVHIGGSYGVHLGAGVVITAAHVAGSEPRVEIAGEGFPTKVVKRGDVDDVDLALLSIDEQKLPASLRLHHMPLCKNPPGTGEPVIVAIPERVARSYVMSKVLLPSDLPEKFQTVIRNVDFGNSGSGVFDAIEKCLLGIISRKISLTQMRLMNGHVVREPYEDIARYFVPVSEIAKFIPPEVRF